MLPACIGETIESSHVGPWFLVVNSEFMKTVEMGGGGAPLYAVFVVEVVVWAVHPTLSRRPQLF